MRARAITIEDVASAAGVSVATVSRALRDLPNVAPSTRAKVREIADEMHYRPDPSAAALAAGRTNTIAMAVPLLDGWYFSQVMAGAEAVLSEAGYDLLMFAVDSDARRQRLLKGPLVKRADGLILVDLRVPDDEAEDLMGGDIKVVTIGIDVAGASSVMVDDFQIAYDAVSHLIALGHRSVAVLAGVSNDPLHFAVPEQRLRGYWAALEAADIVFRDDLVVSGDFSLAGGREATGRLLDLADPPTSIFAMSDEMAFGALRQVWDRGLEAPDDISIIGVDDHDFSEVVGLTTIQQEISEHGAVAARMLLERLSDGSLDAQSHTASTSFLLRSTTAPPQIR